MRKKTSTDETFIYTEVIGGATCFSSFALP